MNRYRFVVMGLCFLLSLVNYLDRAIVSFAIKPIQEDFGLDNTSFGLVVSAFAAGTILVNAAAGWLLDRASVKIVWSASILAWSVVMALLGAVHVLFLFLGLRFLLGVGEGVNFPAMNRALADWVPTEELGRAVAFGLLGVPLAMLVGAPLLSHLIDSIGWRWSFASLGALGLIVGLVWIALYRDGPYREGREDVNREPVPWRELFKDPTLMLTGWSFFAFGYVLFFAISWMPGYLEQTYGMKLTTIGWFSSLPWAIAVLLMPLAGWVSDKLMKRTGSIRKARVHVIWVSQLLAVTFFVPLMFQPSSTVAILCLSLAIGCSMMPNSPYYSICTDLFPRNAGAATGIMVTFFSLSGIVSPLLTGWLSELFGGFGAAFAALIVMVSTAILGLVFFAHPDRRARGALR